MQVARPGRIRCRSPRDSLESRPMPLDAAQVRALIHAAFPPRPLDFTHALTGSLDGGEYVAHVHGKTWLELDRAFMRRRPDPLSFLDPARIAAVLPVYLEILVDDRNAETLVPYTLIPLLTRARSKRRFDAILALLDQDQRRAVKAVLEYVATLSASGPLADAQVALLYWPT